MTTRTASGPPPQSAVTSVELTVGGMACGACAARVERTLRGQDGVVDAGVNFATSRARVFVKHMKSGALDETLATAG